MAADSLANLRYQLVWTTSRRRLYLEGEALKAVADSMVQAAGALGVRIVQIVSGGSFVKVTVEAPPDVAPANIVNHLKRDSARRLRREFPQLRRRSIWTQQYLATSQQDLALDELRRFVEAQPGGGRSGASRLGEHDQPSVEVRRLQAYGPLA